MEKLETIAEQLFEEALDLPPEQRAAFLEAACRGSRDVRQAVWELSIQLATRSWNGWPPSRRSLLAFSAGTRRAGASAAKRWRWPSSTIPTLRRFMTSASRMVSTTSSWSVSPASHWLPKSNPAHL